ncbi:DUF1028 domain-containing protein [Microbacterium aurum]
MTFTVLARDARSGLIGGATASRSLAAGNAVLAVRPGVGAVASQSWTNRALRPLLLDEIAGGATASAAVAGIDRWDDDVELRQVALLPERGAPAARSGAQNTPWAGHLVGEDAVFAGNLLAGADVLTAMRAALDIPPGARDEDDAANPASFARRLVAALAAGEAHGGDARGKQSAAVVVATMGADADIRVDLRVDDHADPVRELARLVELRAEALSVRTA